MKKTSYILDELKIIHDLLLHNFTVLQLFKLIFSKMQGNFFTRYLNCAVLRCTVK